MSTNIKISELPARNAPLDSDVLPVTDVTDLTSSPSGTTKKLTVSNLSTKVSDDIVSANIFSGNLKATKVLSADYTLSDSDSNSIIIANGNITITVPDGLADGFHCIFIQNGVGGIATGTNTEVRDATGNPATNLGASDAVSLMIHKANNTHLLREL